MPLKSTFCLIFFFFTTSIHAELNFIVTENNYVHIYSSLTKKPILSFPYLFGKTIAFGEQKLNIEEKLGSYVIDKYDIVKSKYGSLDHIKKNEDGTITLTFTSIYKKTTIDFDLILTENIDENNISTISIKTDDSFPKNINYFSINLMNTSSAIFGGGIQFSHCNLKGQKVPLLVEENGVGRGDKGSTFLAKLVGAAGNEHSTYAPLPFFMSSNQISYNLSSQNNSYWEADFTKNNTLNFTINKWDNEDLKNFEIKIQQASPLTTVSQHNLARTTLLKDWMYGYILGVQGGKAKVESILDSLHHHNIKVSAIWIQDWVGKRQTSIGSRLQWDWTANETVYPNLKNWIDSLHQENIKVLGYINPYFVEGGAQAQEGIEKAYFTKNEDGSPYKFKAGGFNAYMLDLSNPATINWTKNIIKNNLINNGFDGWMCDFGEWLPFHPTLANNNVLDHNTYPAEWLKLNWTAVKEVNKEKDLFIFNRSAYQNTLQEENIMWLGDQMGDFGVNDGLASAVNAYNSASLSGFPIIHSDIGGYTAINLGPFKFLRNDEALKRWIEMEAFTPLWRSHEGLIPENMSQIYQDKEMMQFFAQFDKIHQDLIPYFKTVNQELIDNGTPMVRHPFLMYPEDENTLDLQYQFFVGNDLLVCPVVKENATTVESYLPKGKWQHFFNKEIFEGGKFYTFDAPIGTPVAFWKVD